MGALLVAFDWLSFLEANHVHYVTRGPNVSHGHVAVHCPFCGTADPSQHMAVSTQGSGWKCWRNREHRGKSPVRLVAALLQVSNEAAASIVGERIFIPEDFLGTVREKLAPRDRSKDERKLVLPDEFLPIDDSYRARMAVTYLKQRGFGARSIRNMTPVYGLRWARDGAFRHRVIFPVHAGGRLVGWTGRTVHDDVTLRYKSLSANPDKAETPAPGPINDFLLWQDDIAENRDGSDTLLICEGPFDGLNMRVRGYELRCEATAIFTASPSKSQMETLHEIAPRYRRKFLLLDRGTMATALRVQNDMLGLGIGMLLLPDEIKDPGEMDTHDLASLLAANKS